MEFDPVEVAKAFRAVNLPLLAETIEQRECGLCRVCCTTKSVDEIQKGAWKACSHICDKGCDIYSERPKSCASYYCAYRMGFGEDDARPDLAGVLVDLDTLKNAGKQNNGMPHMGLCVHADAPYEPSPIRKMILSARERRVYYVGFRSKIDLKEKYSPTQFYADPVKIDERLAQHSRTGLTEWNFESG